jgi:CheY-like chemotaxis protein
MDSSTYLNLVTLLVWPTTVITIVALLANARNVRRVIDLYAKDLEAKEHHKRNDSWLFGLGPGNTQVVALLAAATVAMRYEQRLRHPTVDAKTKNPFDIPRIQKVISRISSRIQSGSTQTLRGKKIMWAHTERHHDLLERELFETLQATVDFYLSTDEIIEQLDQGAAPDLIISNMNRDNNKEAGIMLFEKLKMRAHHDGKLVPFIIYTRTDDLQVKRKALAMGIHNFVNYPEDLLDVVLLQLSSSSDSASHVEKSR